MKNSIKNSKTLTTLIAVIMIVTVAVPFLSMPTTNAADTIKTYAYVTATPSPAGVGQTVSIVFWLNWPPPSAAGTTGDRWTGCTIDVTRPNGEVDHLGPFVTDSVGSAYTAYSPTEVGEYKVVFNFPGQILQPGNPGYTGLNGSNSNSPYVGRYFGASSANTTFIVQEEPVPTWTQPALPISYWERPIDTQNTYWYVLGSHWLGQSEQGYNYLRYQPAGRAPDTAHVMWTKPISYGGIVGGVNVGPEDVNFYSGTAYQYRFPNPLILYGKLFYPLPLANSPTGGGYACVDLRTGQEEWRKDFGSANPSFGQLYDFESPNQHGVNPNGYLWIVGTVIGTGITNPATGATYTNASYTQASSNASAVVNTAGWIAVDPMTGTLLFNETNIPSGTRFYGPQGEILIMNIGRENTTAPYTYLWQWNNTKLPGNDIAGGITQWLPGRTNWNMSKSYDWNVTLSQPLPAGANTAIIQVLPGDLVFGRSSALQFAGSTGGAFGTPDPYTLWAINLNASRAPIGQVMWIRNYTGDANMTILIGPRDQKTNVFTTYFKETMQWNGYSLLTGEKLWGPTNPEETFNFYGGTTGLTAPYAAGDGRLYSTGYSGVVYCYDFLTGKTLFTYGNDVNNPKNNTRTPNTAYGDYPYQVAAIADGKVYLISSEHSLNAPPYAGAEVRCINATTGEEIWKMVGMCNWQEIAVADGYFVYLNLNDMRITCVGPGPSATSVSASSAVIPQGGSVLITGTVTDQSPNTALKGTAAISDADQGAWMNYMVTKTTEKPIVKGVEVSLDTYDPNGNYYHIDTVTSDSNGMFKKLWTPEVPGEYTIIATFKGSGSYGPSSAATAIGVSEPQATTSPPAYPAPVDNTMAIALSAIAIIIVVVIGMALILATLRKRP
ncbi:MAG: PQQ-like beta-propeller repeat protein [Candidatus Bathyarchaeota archaeon]|nr:PQQ-like beta-propeller repeat protein [Candidatus Bathyarchaeota archaeon]